MADLSLALKVDEGAYRVLDRYPMVDRMELVKLNTLEPEPFQAVRTGMA